MKHPVVLDACTIINLLRIDEDEFLFRLLCSLRLYVADLVNQEITLDLHLRITDKIERINL